MAGAEWEMFGEGPLHPTSAAGDGKALGLTCNPKEGPRAEVFATKGQAVLLVQHVQR